MEKSIQFRDQPVFYSVTGKGKILMLVHGFGEDGTIWENQLAELDPHFTVIVPDLPGSGRSPMSSKGDKQDHQSIEDYADLLNCITLNEHTDSLIMIGHSMGGYITLAFAEKFPEKLIAFGLFHSSAFADNEEKKSTRLKAIDFINTNNAAAFLKTATPNLFSPAFQNSSPDKIEEIINRYNGFSKEALTGYYYAMIERPERIDVLKNYSEPVLFIIGEHDSAIPFDASMKQCHLPAESEIQIFPTGHMAMIEKPEESTAALMHFCKRMYP